VRAIWKGSISWGLVSIPVKVVSAIASQHSVAFNQHHVGDLGRVRYRKVCELDGKELAPEEIVKGYEAGDGRTAVITDADLADLPLPTAHTIEVHGFLQVGDVDPIQLGKPYFLAPDATASKPYVLMREALRRSGKAAVAKLAMRGHETLALIRVREDTLLLHQLHWADEINSSQGVAPAGNVTVTDAELQLADTLIDALGPADLSDFTDDYQAAVERVVAAKLEGGPVPTAASGQESAGQVLDLMTVLQHSVEAAKDAQAGQKPTQAKRAPAKKTAKKTG
jgi:DNA end-binding protein Ku